MQLVCRRYLVICLAGVIFLPLAKPVKAQIVLPKILADHMVLQRDMPIRLWGWASPGETVTAIMKQNRQSAVADELGQWSLDLPALPAGGPYTIEFHGSNTVLLQDILMGDLWLASGQSNMEMPLVGFGADAPLKDSAKEIASADLPQLRLFHVMQASSPYPADNLTQDATWTACTPATVAHFSAVAYFFARDLQKDIKVPIGIIDSTWGGTPGESWTSLHTLTADPSFMDLFAAYSDLMDSRADALRSIDFEHKADEDAKKAGQPLSKHPRHLNPLAWSPGVLYNGMIAPLTPLRIRGVIWYQGESSSAPVRAAGYLHLFSALIGDWRNAWHEGDFPFLFVQIANVKADADSLLPVVREAQRRTLSVANTAMVVTIDIGNPDNVHYANKQAVGERLALAARSLSYGEPVEFSGPLYRQTARDGAQLHVYFDHATGLYSASGKAKGFEIAGPDHKYAPADAKIDGDAVILSSTIVKDPIYVRYGWQNVPDLSLYNAAHLPASPFTTEDFDKHMQDERFAH